MRNPSICGALLCAALFFGIAGCQARAPEGHSADLVLRGGVVHTVSDEQRRAEAIAVTDGGIIFVGGNDDVEAHIGPETDIVELDGRLVLPGIIDAHLHPLGGAVKELYQCNFPFSATPEEVRQAVAACVEAQPDAEWITGGQWDSAFFDRFELESPRAFLDRVSGDAAIVLSDDSGHNAWVNSKALELVGISAATTDPEGGTIVRAEDGSPNGVMLETAQGLVYAVIPKLSDELFLESARWFSKSANAYGITAIKAAAIEEEEIRAFKAADDSDTLNLHVATSFRTPYGRRVERLDYNVSDRIRDN